MNKMIKNWIYNGIHLMNFPVSNTDDGGRKMNKSLSPEFLTAAYQEERWSEVRAERDALIAATNSIYMRHSREIRSGKIVDDVDNRTTLSSSDLTKLDSYVQTLADIPQQFSDPDAVVLPPFPEF
ncbi:hypothetical protein VR7878_02057 [Vibrio ruber DSM 16370]|uniref:Phage tail assembly chaperone-like domain-containing protein n=1 Tax=Vibrio ruber (strain DSM 16370 / JCM 11486 / BCRC 17186 / CECT 7878 / LMG 23124 / VR1) TaxID=1123498 RepID=A0A1R4LK80_VIBR1|nr:phage tail assembly chaperone [Vibrio ruber]SJN56980.1 hypothetical protein VR7878_02057 [Vibrio ruber DSM 16370]